jgi:c-di-GMP-binding flagellar brake protein YcgR
MDQRRYPRLHLHVPIRFVVEEPEKRDAQAGQEILKNISYGGVLFLVEPPLPVKPGQVREFSFYLHPEPGEACDPAHFRAQGVVRRIEPPVFKASAYGVAVQFLSALKMQKTRLTLVTASRGRG